MRTTSVFLCLALIGAAPLAAETPWERDTKAADAARLDDHPKEAESLYQLALKDAQAEKKTTFHVAGALNNLAEFYRGQRMFSKAEPLYRRGLDVARDGKDAESLAVLQQNLGQMYEQQGNTKDAETWYTAALKTADIPSGPKLRVLPAVLNNLATLYLYQDKPDAAEPILKRAVSLLQQTAESDAPELALAYSNLAQIRVMRHDGKGAISLLQESVVSLEKTRGKERFYLGAAMGSLGAVYLQLGQLANAEKNLTGALEIMQETQPDNRNVGDVLENLGGLYIEQQQYFKAEPYLKRSATLIEKTRGKDDPALAASLGSLAGVYVSEGDGAKAEPLLQRAADIQAKAKGEHDPEVGELLSHLSQLQMGAGEWSRAEITLRRLLPLWEALRGKEDGDTLRVASGVGLTLMQQKKPAEAEPYYQRAVDGFERSSGQDSLDVARELHNLFASYVEQRRFDKAEPAIRRALAIREKALGHDDPATINLRHELTGMLREAGRSKDADAVENP